MKVVSLQLFTKFFGGKYLLGGRCLTVIHDSFSRAYASDGNDIAWSTTPLLLLPAVVRFLVYVDRHVGVLEAYSPWVCRTYVTFVIQECSIWPFSSPYHKICLVSFPCNL